MPKPQYEQKFRQAWLKDPLLKNWLIAVESSSGITGKCKMCNQILSNRYADLKSHKDSKKHKKNENLILGPCPQSRIPFQKETDLFVAKQTEGRLSLFVAQHTSVNVSDYLTNTCRKCFDSKVVDNVQMHKTKCSAIIKNVLASYFFEDLKSDIGDSKYSLIIDESTDITVKKYLGIIIILVQNI